MAFRTSVFGQALGVFFKDAQMVFENTEMVGKSQERERDEERRTAKGVF